MLHWERLPERSIASRIDVGSISDEHIDLGVPFRYHPSHTLHVPEPSAGYGLALGTETAPKRSQ